MRDGLYKVHFQTPLGSGAGVVYAKGGQMWGGDSSIYYVGSYSISGDKLTAEVTTDEHTKQTGMTNVFGVEKATIKLNGAVAGDVITTQGSSPQAPGISFSAVLTRISD